MCSGRVQQIWCKTSWRCFRGPGDTLWLTHHTSNESRGTSTYIKVNSSFPLIKRLHMMKFKLEVYSPASLLIDLFEEGLNVPGRPANDNPEQT